MEKKSIYFHGSKLDLLVIMCKLAKPDSPWGKTLYYFTPSQADHFSSWAKNCFLLSLEHEISLYFHSPLELSLISLSLLLCLPSPVSTFSALFICYAREKVTNSVTNFMSYLSLFFLFVLFHFNFLINLVSQSRPESSVFICFISIPLQFRFLLSLYSSPAN